MSERAVLALRRSLAHVGASNRTEVSFSVGYLNIQS
jgi:hypothetical protein